MMFIYWVNRSSITPMCRRQYDHYTPIPMSNDFGHLLDGPIWETIRGAGCQQGSGQDLEGILQTGKQRLLDLTFFATHEPIKLSPRALAISKEIAPRSLHCIAWRVQMRAVLYNVRIYSECMLNIYARTEGNLFIFSILTWIWLLVQCYAWSEVWGW